jgi:hypothetical protein
MRHRDVLWDVVQPTLSVLANGLRNHGFLARERHISQDTSYKGRDIEGFQPMSHC